MKTDEQISSGTFWTKLAERDPGSVRQIWFCHQTGEAIKRARLIVDRVMPRLPPVNGFWEFSEFCDPHRSAYHARRNELRRDLEKQLQDKISARDNAVSDQEIGRRLDLRNSLAMRCTITSPAYARLLERLSR